MLTLCSLDPRVSLVWHLRCVPLEPFVMLSKVSTAYIQCLVNYGMTTLLWFPPAELSWSLTLSLIWGFFFHLPLLALSSPRYKDLSRFSPEMWIGCSRILTGVYIKAGLNTDTFSCSCLWSSPSLQWLVEICSVFVVACNLDDSYNNWSLFLSTESSNPMELTLVSNGAVPFSSLVQPYVGTSTVICAGLQNNLFPSTSY